MNEADAVVEITVEELQLLDEVVAATAEGRVYHYNGGQCYLQTVGGGVLVVDHVSGSVRGVDLSARESHTYQSWNRTRDPDPVYAETLKEFFRSRFVVA